MPSLYPEFLPGELIPEADVRNAFGACGLAPRVFRGCRIIGPDKVCVGDAVQIDEQVFIAAGQGVIIGHHVHLAFASSISGGGECILHDFASIAAGVRLVTGTERVDAGGLTNPTIPPEFRTVSRGRIDVGAYAVLFTNSVVLPGVTIGEGAVVSAGSIVHHDLRPWRIYAGRPLVQIGVREADPVLAKGRTLLKGWTAKNGEERV